LTLAIEGQAQRTRVMPASRDPADRPEVGRDLALTKLVCDQLLLLRQSHLVLAPAHAVPGDVDRAGMEPSDAEVIGTSLLKRIVKKNTTRYAAAAAISWRRRVLWTTAKGKPSRKRKHEDEHDFTH